MPAADELRLIDRCRQGDQGAYRDLVERHMRDVYNLAFSFLQDHDEADDVAQETFVRAHRSLDGFRGEAGLGTWLYRIATNLALDRLRQRRRAEARKIPMDDDESRAVTHSSPDTDAMGIDLHIERALHTLPTLQRAVIMLRHMDGLSTKQVSDILRCSEGTVKTHLHRGLRKMRRLLRQVKEEMT